MFTLIKARYQKGDKKDEFTGAIYFRGQPTYGNNENFKDKLFPVFLKERLRWNDELKLYTAKVYTPEQAIMVLDNMREVSEECEKSLAHISVDESIFDDAKEASITMFPLEVDGKMTLAVGGTTFPWGDKLKKEKFSFEHIVNGEPLNLWLRDEDTNADMDADPPGAL